MDCLYNPLLITMLLPLCVDLLPIIGSGWAVSSHQTEAEIDTRRPLTSVEQAGSLPKWVA